MKFIVVLGLALLLLPSSARAMPFSQFDKLSIEVQDVRLTHGIEPSDVLIYTAWVSLRISDDESLDPSPCLRRHICSRSASGPHDPSTIRESQFLG